MNRKEYMAKVYEHQDTLDPTATALSKAVGKLAGINSGINGHAKAVAAAQGHFDAARERLDDAQDQQQGYMSIASGEKEAAEKVLESAKSAHATKVAEVEKKIAALKVEAGIS